MPDHLLQRRRRRVLPVEEHMSAPHRPGGRVQLLATRAGDGKSKQHKDKHMGQERGLFGTRCTFWHTPAATAPSKTCALRYAPLAVSWKPHVPPTKHSSSTHPVAAMRRPRVQKPDPVCLLFFFRQ